MSQTATSSVSGFLMMLSACSGAITPVPTMANLTFTHDISSLNASCLSTFHILHNQGTSSVFWQLLQGVSVLQKTKKKTSRRMPFSDQMMLMPPVAFVAKHEKRAANHPIDNHAPPNSQDPQSEGGGKENAGSDSKGPHRTHTN